MKEKRITKLAVIMIVFVCLLTACSPSAPGQDERQVLRILYGNQESFLYQYGNYFAVKFPELDVEIVSTENVFKPGNNYMEEYEKLIKEEKPDLVIIPSLPLYEKLAASNSLMDLDSLIKRDKFDLTPISPVAIDLMKTAGQNKLYGLAPQFTSTALYYNKELFDRYQIPYPHDRMTWEETMILARRFPVDADINNRIYGLHEKYRTAFDFVYDIAGTNGLNYINEDGTKVILDSPAWMDAFRYIIEGFKSGSLYYYDNGGKPINYGPVETKQMDLFSAGKAAMMISTPEQMMRMKQNNVKLDWDLVTIPVDPKNPELTRTLNVSTIYAVGASAEHRDTAWKVIQYFNGEEAARVNVKTSEGLSTRLLYAKDKDGRSLEAFYKLKRDDRGASLYPNISTQFYAFFEQLAIAEIDAAVKGKQSVEETVKSIQAKAQEELTKQLLSK
ncbi:MAG: extracellular solute-binding protein [Paenibacillus sp.]|nr:extracellular solute-binding protein [Paenibacillus sp.]